ncbi:MAG: sigma-54-dependent Fis family transcriptional regulator [Myxococcaceae bacterium]|nr:sigma-54-dependent Fis family transcriptional regulator [Myxococcaceae bacterium]
MDTKTNGLVLGPSMQKLVALVERIAQGHLPVLVLGETGAGKERIAELLHRASPRREGPYVKLNCAALTQTLLESELFGHEKAAFTGAVTAKPGLLETADGGTLLLDEVGELPLTTQAKLLRVLEEKAVFRVGSLKGRPIDVRFVAATNRNVETAIEQGTFRQDLYFRLTGSTVWVPPLRDRPGDVLPLAKFFVEGAANGRPVALSAQAERLLEGYAWPGNVRELKNLMEHAVLVCGDGPITAEHLPVEKLQRKPHVVAPPVPPSPTVSEGTPALSSKLSGTEWKRSLKAVEKKRITRALEEAGGNQTEAAKRLGWSRRTLIKRLEELGFPRPRKKK